MMPILIDGLTDMGQCTDTQQGLVLSKPERKGEKWGGGRGGSGRGGGDSGGGGGGGKRGGSGSLMMGRRK